MQIFGLILLALRVLQLLIIIHAVVSWFRPNRYHPALALLDSIVEPILRPIRRVLHPYMRNVPLDFSPLVALILIDVVRALLFRLLLTGWMLG